MRKKPNRKKEVKLKRSFSETKFKEINRNMFLSTKGKKGFKYSNMRKHTVQVRCERNVSM